MAEQPISWQLKLERKLLNAPQTAAMMRRFFVRTMDLPTGSYQVRFIDNVRAPMPDGVTLATDHYAPVPGGRYPVILIRTPYSRGGGGSLIAGLFAWQFATFGYHVLCQDVRGRFDSEGEYVPFLHEAEDGRATLDWLAAQPWCDGNIGMWGASYLGYCQWAAAAAGAPQLKALAPIITHSNLMHYPTNGFPMDLLLRWMFQMASMDDPTLSMRDRMQRLNAGALQDQFLSAAFAHLPLLTADEVAIGRVSSLYREMADADPTHPHWTLADYSATVAASPPADFTGGWHDLFLDGLLADFSAQQAAGKQPQLTVGPWHHLAMGYLPIAFKNGLAWFDTHLKGEPGRRRAHPVRVQVMGGGGWREFDHWPPPAQATRLYLQGSGAAKTGRLRLEPPPAGMAADTYRYDPANPTPNLGGAKMGDDAGAVDNRPLERRRDVLVFSTPPLHADLTLIGPVYAELYVNTDRPSADFFVRLCDVDRKGLSLNVCDGNLRIEPAQLQAQADGSLHITVTLSATAYRFRAGHRLRLLVASGAHPRFARNLGIEGAQSTSTVMSVAQQTLYHDAGRPSAVVLPVAQ